MKTLFFLIGNSLFTLNLAYAQITPSIQWQKCLGGYQYDEGYSIIQTTDGGYIVGGCSASLGGDITTNHGGTDCWVIKLNVNGGIEWQKTYGGSRNDFLYCIIQTSDGGYAFTGTTNSENGDVTENRGDNDYWVVKLDGTGNLEWQVSYGGYRRDIAYSMVQTNDGGYAIAGCSPSNDGDVSGHHGNNSYFEYDGDFWIIKLRSDGALEWNKSLGCSKGDRANSIIQTMDGGLAVAGYSSFNDGDVTGNHGGDLPGLAVADYWVVKLNSSGGIEWQKSLGGMAEDKAYCIIQTRDGGYAVAGHSKSGFGGTDGSQGSDIDYWIVKLSSYGAIQWQRSYGGSNDDIAYSIRQTTDGGYVIAGYSESNNIDVSGNHGLYDTWVLRISGNGSKLWQKSLGGSKNEEAHDIIQTLDGGYAVVGYTESDDGDITGHHNSNGTEDDYLDVWVIKLNGDGTDVADELPESNIKVYTNPVYDGVILNISANLIGSSYVITDLMGKMVSKGVLTVKESNISLSNLSKGLYLIQVGNQSFKFPKNL